MALCPAVKRQFTMIQIWCFGLGTGGEDLPNANNCKRFWAKNK